MSPKQWLNSADYTIGLVLLLIFVGWLFWVKPETPAQTKAANQSPAKYFPIGKSGKK